MTARCASRAGRSALVGAPHPHAPRRAHASLSGDLAADSAAVRDAVRAFVPAARACRRPVVAAALGRASNRSVRDGSLPASEAVIDEILRAADGSIVSIYAAGPVWRGFANSEGQRNWHATTAFNLWSLYHRTDKAVKSGHAGFAWDSAASSTRWRSPAAPRSGRPSRTLRARQVPRLSRPIGDGGNHSTPVLGLSGALKTRQRAREDAGGRGARPARHLGGGHRRRCRALVRQGFASVERAADRGGQARQLARDRARRANSDCENGANGAEMPIACDGRRHARRRSRSRARHRSRRGHLHLNFWIAPRAASPA